MVIQATFINRINQVLYYMVIQATLVINRINPVLYYMVIQATFINRTIQFYIIW